MIKDFSYDSDFLPETTDMGNRLFCTFTTPSQVEDTLKEIRQTYSILYGKIFVLSYEDGDDTEYVCTYNVDLNNVLHFIEDTILVHRKKHTNTLYTINALNELIKELNDGELDKSYNVNWNRFKNTILLTKGDDLYKFKTSLNNIVEI